MPPTKTTTSTVSVTSRLPLPTRRRSQLLILLALLAVLPALTLIVATGGRAEAHGTPMKPGSRTFLCWQDGMTDTVRSNR